MSVGTDPRRRLIDANYFSVRPSPYQAGTLAAGAGGFDHINHMSHAVDFGGDKAEGYAAMHEAIALYDAAIERQVEVRGPDAAALCERVFTRDVGSLEELQSRYGYLCWPDGAIITDSVLTRLAADRFWLSPTIVDVRLWVEGIAVAEDLDVEVDEAAWASAHLHGPRAVDLLTELAGEEVEAIRPYRSTWATIGGVEVFVARTVASASGGFEVFSPDEGAMTVWDELVRAGAGHGLVVKGFDSPEEALEAGMVMISYATNSSDRLTPLEFWRPFLDLDGADFIGKRALQETIAAGGPARKLVGMVGGEATLALLDRAATVVDGGEEVGFTRWMVRSPALDRNIAVAVLEASYASRVGDEVTVLHPEGEEQMTITELPFVEPRK